MKTAEEVAKQLTAHFEIRLSSPVRNYSTRWLKLELENALTAYAKERVKITKESRCEASWAGGRAEALEEAAKVVGNLDALDIEYDWVRFRSKACEAIRTLKTTTPEGMHGGDL